MKAITIFLERHQRLILALQLVVFLGLAGYRLNARWLRGDEGYAGAQHHAIARHQLAHGLARTNFAQFRIFHDLTSDELFDANGTFRGEELRHHYGDRFWTSRLPLGSMLHTASLAVFGDREWTVRLVPLTATMLMILSVFFLLRGAYGAPVALLASGVLALTPGTVLHARLAGYEMPCLMLVTVTLILWDRYRMGMLPETGARAAVFISALLAGLIGWFGLFAPVLMFLESFRQCPRVCVKWRERLALLLIPFMVVGLYVLYVRGLGQSFGDQLDYFWTRRSLGATSQFTALEWLNTMQKYFFNHVTPLPVLLAGGWAVLWVRARWNRERLPGERLILMLGAFALLVYVSAAGSAYEHRYYIIWSLPLICIGGAFFLAQVLGLSFGTENEADETEHKKDASSPSPARWRVAALAGITLLLAASALYKVNGHHEKAADERELILMAERARKHIALEERVFVPFMAEGKRYGFPHLNGMQPATGFSDYRYPRGAPFLFYLWRQTGGSITVKKIQDSNNALQFMPPSVSQDPHRVSRLLLWNQKDPLPPPRDEGEWTSLGTVDGKPVWLIRARTPDKVK